MTAEQYKKKLVTYLEHLVKLNRCSKELEKDNYEYYSKRETFDFHKAVDSHIKICGAERSMAILTNLIRDVKDGTVDLTMED